MKIHIGEAVTALGIENFVLDGEPTNETEFNSSFKKIVGVKNDEAVMSSNPGSFGVTWDQVKTKYDKLVSAEPHKLLREERDKRLTACDWVAAKHTEHGKMVPEDWKIYRQALRDLPSVSYRPELDESGDLKMNSVAWPTPPE